MSLTTGKSFLENKCGYSQCVNMVEDGGENYVNLGGFIFVTRSCEQHKDVLMKFLLALTRAMYHDASCLQIISESEFAIQRSIETIIKLADETMSYPQKPNNSKKNNNKEASKANE